MRYLLLFLVFFITEVTTAQNLLPTPRNIEKTYTRGTRSTDGKPGKNYWQNTADYTINVDYDPATRLLKGIEDIVYTNNSPDTLRQISFKLYQNLYKTGSPRTGRIDPNDVGEGVIIDSLWINGARTEPARLTVNATNATIGRQSIAKGEKVEFRIAWHFTLNKGSHIRTGEIEPNAAFIAYFFPRIAVYDDIDGWNTLPYTGVQEFYNDFCNFNVSITVPENFGVWATGDAQNARDLMKPAYYARLKEAEKSDKIITVIDSVEIKNKDITMGGGPHTWNFIAKNVTDFAFATSDHYVWQSSSVEVDTKTKRRVRVDAVFNPKHSDYWLVTGDGAKTVEAMSFVFPAWPFPYSHITVFDGLDQMEYPMMVNDNPVEDRAESISLTDHEIFHTMFPFYMGINETKYAWMDEGWATIGEWLITPLIDTTLIDDFAVNWVSALSGYETDLPIVTPSSELSRGYSGNSYPKPAMGYLYVKDYLGDAVFTKALHRYIAQWNGKHPMPNDFFYSMNAGAGKNLNWFWKKWFFELGVTDLGISSVKKTGNNYSITVANKGGKPMPVDLIVTYKDGSTQKIHRSIGVWEKGNATTVISFTSVKAVSTITLEDPHTPDSNRTDNVYKMK